MQGESVARPGREDGIISSRDEIFPVNSLVAYPYQRSSRNEEKIGRDWRRPVARCVRERAAEGARPREKKEDG